MCPLSVSVSRPVAASQTFSVLSPLPRDDLLAVGAEGHAVNLAAVPLEREGVLAGRRVPDLQRAVQLAADDPLAVGAEGDAGNPAGVSLERERFLTAGRVPNLQRLVTRCRVTIRLPSGLKATLERFAVCPLRVKISCPLAASQTFSVPSKLP